MPAYDEFQPNRVKHLELLQAVIARLGNNSFLIKGWAVTVAGAFWGFAINSERWELAAASILTTVAFWALDAYFLTTERLFRALYDHVAGDNIAVEPFFMGATSPEFLSTVRDGSRPKLGSRWKTGWSTTLRTFYGLLIAAALVVSGLIALSSDGDKAGKGASSSSAQERG